MFGSNSRWNLLFAFALFNLIFWVGVAIAVGLLAGREVDLGIEQSVREYQATAAAALQRVTSSATPLTVWPSVGATELRADHTPTAIPTNPPTRVAATATRTPLPFDTPALQPKPRSFATRSPTPRPTTHPLPTVRPAAPSPAFAATPTLIRQPLLLANPPLQDLSDLDREMARSAPGRPVQIRYHEDDLNREIAALLAANPDQPYRDVSVDLRRGRVVVRGSTEVLNFTVPVEVTGRVTAVDCRPRIEIEQVTVGGLLTPSFVREEVREMVLEAESWYPADYPLCLEQIVLEEDRATIYGHRR